MARRTAVRGWWAALAAGLVLCAALPGAAQERAQRGGPGRFGGGFQIGKVQLLQLEQVQQELKLSDEQTQQVRQISEDVRTQMREAFQGGGGPEAREQIQKVAADAEEKVKDVLKEDQAKRLNEIVVQVTGPEVLARDRELAERLDVSRDQQREIREIVQEQQEKRRELFAGARGEGRERFAEIRDKMEEIRKETDERILGALSDEQKQKWEQLKGEPFELDRSQLRGGFGGGRPRGNR